MSNTGNEGLEFHKSADGWVTIHTATQLEPQVVGGDLLSIMSPVDWGTVNPDSPILQIPSHRDAVSGTYPDVIATGFEEGYFKHES